MPMAIWFWWSVHVTRNQQIPPEWEEQPRTINFFNKQSYTFANIQKNCINKNADEENNVNGQILSTEKRQGILQLKNELLTFCTNYPNARSEPRLMFPSEKHAQNCFTEKRQLSCFRGYPFCSSFMLCFLGPCFFLFNPVEICPRDAYRCPPSRWKGRRRAAEAAARCGRAAAQRPSKSRSGGRTRFSFLHYIL